jgi:UDP-glucose 4-epimerase
MRVALLGATGIAGQGIAAALAAAGHEAVAWGRRGNLGRHIDLAQPGAGMGIDWRGIDALVHAAGITDETARDPELGPRIAIESWRTVLEAAKRAGLTRAVYISSAHVYGALEGRIEEDAFPKPANDYARLHLAAEQVLRSSGIASDVIRACNLYGRPADFQRFERWALVPYGFPREAVETGKIVLKSPGVQQRNFLAARRLGEIVVATLALAPAPWRMRNAAGRDTMSVRDFAARVAFLARTVLGRDIAIEAPPPVPAPPALSLGTSWGETGATQDDLDGFLCDMLETLAAKRDG